MLLDSLDHQVRLACLVSLVNGDQMVNEVPQDSEDFQVVAYVTYSLYISGIVYTVSQCS